jgi:hypothetical protein
MAVWVLKQKEPSKYLENSKNTPTPRLNIVKFQNTEE